MNDQKKISKFSKSFEIGKDGQSNVLGGTSPIKTTTGYYLPNNEACSPACPDERIDYYYN